MSGVALPAGDGLELVLSAPWTAAPLHALILPTWRLGSRGRS
ncbi:hypothetical protein [Kineococcus aurantiacus]